MPQIAFFPWAKITKAIAVGGYRLAWYGDAVTAGEIPADQVASTEVVLQAYDDRARPSDLARVPVLIRVGHSATADLDEMAEAALFAFRDRLAFAGLAARRFFSDRYLCSEHLRLVVQGFLPGGSHGVLQQSRRRDGVARNYVSRDRLRIERPLNVARRCSLDAEIDVDLLLALESTTTLSADDCERLDDAVRLFVGANTDNDAVSEHSEVIDVVSVFNRLADAEKANKIVPEVDRLLPDSGWRPCALPIGVRGQAVEAEAVDNGETIRSTWLRDLFSLRHPCGHGKVNAEHGHVRWSRAEHMLIAAVVVPLAMKAFLRERGLYTFSPTDERMDRFVSGAILLEPPRPDDQTDVDGEQLDAQPYSYEQRWNATMDDALVWPWVHGIASAAEREFSDAQSDAAVPPPEVADRTTGA